MTTTRSGTILRDPAIWFFLFGILFTFLVSMTGTRDVLAWFHQTDGTFAIPIWNKTFPAGALTLALALLSMELGAIGCKITALWMPSWERLLSGLTVAMLTFTTVANFILGWDTFQAQAYTVGTMAWGIQQDRLLASLFTFAYSAWYPICQGVFIFALVNRWKQIRIADQEQDDTIIVVPIDTFNGMMDQINTMQGTIREQEQKLLEGLMTRALPEAAPEEVTLLCGKRRYTIDELLRAFTDLGAETSRSKFYRHLQKYGNEEINER